ncbi:MAG: glycosyltransferase family 2 protein [Lachnospiraceae bacterium]|nr:glycosyltransferase family 2 protein [Lachnospiraceae bacterium]
MSLLTIVVPCYNEEAALPLFYDEISRTIDDFKNTEPDLSFELLFIDDGSKDRTIEIIKELRAGDERVHYVSFSRNFGKEAGIYAGLENAAGDYVVIMDADLQDPPSLLPEMYAAVTREGYDTAATRRVTRQGEPPVRSFFARQFYKIMNSVTDLEIMDGARDYRIMTRTMVNAVLGMKEYNRFTKGIYSWVGFKTKWIDYENRERVAGETKWNFWKLLLYSIEGFVGFTTAPLTIAAVIGLFFTLAAFIMIVFIIIRTLIYGDPTSGWPSMICIMVFMGGVQLFCIGLVGEYLAKTYLETKNRPIYIAREKE